MPPFVSLSTYLVPPFCSHSGQDPEHVRLLFRLQLHVLLVADTTGFHFQLFPASLPSWLHHSPSLAWVTALAPWFSLSPILACLTGAQDSKPGDLSETRQGPVEILKTLFTFRGDPQPFVIWYPLPHHPLSAHSAPVSLFTAPC